MRYLKNLNLQFKKNKDKWELFFYALLVVFLLNSLFNAAFIYFFDTNNTNIFSNYSHLANSYILQFGSFAVFMSILFIVPVLDEFLFRAWIRFSVNGVSLFISALLFLLLHYTLKKYGFWIPVMASVILIPLCYLLARKCLKVCNPFLKFADKKINKLHLILFSSILFGIVHLYFEKGPGVYMILLSLFHVIYGIVLGFLRLKNGLGWSILLHVSINVIPAISLFS